MRLRAFSIAIPIAIAIAMAFRRERELELRSTFAKVTREGGNAIILYHVMC